MDKKKRKFIKNIGLVATGLQLQSCASTLLSNEKKISNNSIVDKPLINKVNDWQQVRQEFNLDDSNIHLANFLITSHPRIVRDDIAYHRNRIDKNPAKEMHHESIWHHENESRDWAARYLGVKTAQIALVGSTTAGLGLIYNGLKIHPNQEVLTSEHDHWATKGALRYRSEKDGITIKTIKLFDNSLYVSTDEVLQSISQNINDKTRVLALTWVHSGSGVKLPISEIGKLVTEINQQRDQQNKILFCVDGVHGLGVENTSFDELNCDFLMAGTHKWMFGPRGTAIICSRSEQMDNIRPTIDSFSARIDFGTTMTSGGFHAFEHQWAMRKAFEFHLQLGKEQVQNRIHQLNTELKQQLKQLPGIQLVTPESTAFSAGFTFFRINNIDCEKIASYLQANRVAVDATERDVGPVVRMAPGLLNNEQEIEQVIRLLSRYSA